jgi:hypothetical protein
VQAYRNDSIPIEGNYTLKEGAMHGCDNEIIHEEANSTSFS